MGRITIVFYFICISSLLTAQPSEKKVLVIGIDGCRSDALIAANTPNIDNLLTNSIYSYYALNNEVTYSGPGWSAMLTGVWSAKHGVTNNSFNGSNYDEYPHFIQRVEEFDPTLYTVSISQWHPINNNIVAGDADYTYNAINQIGVTATAITQLSDEDPDVIFLHYDDVDHAGHSSGFSPTNPTYLSAIESVDQQVRLVLIALENRPTYENEDWLILISTDHGGIGTGHGGNSIEEQTIFYIAHNQYLEQEELLPDTSLMSDVSNCIENEDHLILDGDNDLVNVPLLPAYNFGSNQDFTIECRVKTSSPGDVAIVGNKNWNSGVNDGFVLSYKYPNGPEWKVNIGDGSNRVDINTGGAIADNTWHHIAVSFDRDGDMIMYEDGQMISSLPISTIGNIDNGFPLRFGADVNGSFDYSGAIEEVRLWNKVISQAEIDDYKCLSLNSAHPDYGNLIGYWPLNEGNGAIAYDLSTNQNDGTITSPQWESLNTVISYESTPKITDIASTALDYLCIELDTSWSLDGVSWLDSFPVVHSSIDSTIGSLRYAVAASCPDDIITFDSIIIGQDILVNKGGIIIPHDLSILGSFIPYQEISAENLNPIFELSPGIELKLQQMVLKNSPLIGEGGIIHNQGTLLIEDVDIKE